MTWNGITSLAKAHMLVSGIYLYIGIFVMRFDRTLLSLIVQGQGEHPVIRVEVWNRVELIAVIDPCCQAKSGDKMHVETGSRNYCSEEMSPIVETGPCWGTGPSDSNGRCEERDRYTGAAI